MLQVPRTPALPRADPSSGAAPSAARFPAGASLLVRGAELAVVGGGLAAGLAFTLSTLPVERIKTIQQASAGEGMWSMHEPADAHPKHARQTCTPLAQTAASGHPPADAHPRIRLEQAVEQDEAVAASSSDGSLPRVNDKSSVVDGQ